MAVSETGGAKHGVTKHGGTLELLTRAVTLAVPPFPSTQVQHKCVTSAMAAAREDIADAADLLHGHAANGESELDPPPIPESAPPGPPPASKTRKTGTRPKAPPKVTATKSARKTRKTKSKPVRSPTISEGDESTGDDTVPEHPCPEWSYR